MVKPMEQTAKASHVYDCIGIGLRPGFRPPFLAPALCWCALTMVESTRISDPPVLFR